MSIEHLRSVIDQTEVDDTEMRIHRRKGCSEAAYDGNGAAPARMPSFVRKWCAAPGEDDNYVYVITLQSCF